MRNLSQVSIHRSIANRHPAPCSTGCDIENDGGDWYLSAAVQSPLSVTDPHEGRKLKKSTLTCKIHSKRLEEGAEATIMKAHESDGQQKQLFEFNI
jgi:hypothetical protein